MQDLTPFPFFSFFAAMLVIVCWAIQDFYKPYTYKEFAYSTTFRRYLLGLCVYCVGCVILYTLSAPLFWKPLIHFKSWFETMSISEGGVSAISSSLTLVFIMTASWLPFIGYFAARAKRAAQDLAYFPDGIKRFESLLDGCDFKEHASAEAVVDGEILFYTVNPQNLHADTFAVSRKLLKEIESISLALDEMAKDTRFSSVIASIRRVYADDLLRISLRRGQLYHRLAKLFSIFSVWESHSLPEADFLGDIVRPFEEFITSIRNKYRRIVLSGSLSLIMDASKRGEFLGCLGYQVPYRVSLPFWPIAITFSVVLLTTIISQLYSNTMKNLMLSIGHQLEWERYGHLSIFIIAIMLAIKLCLAIVLAVNPKFYYVYARPSLRSLPEYSYIYYGTFSFCVSFLLSLWQFYVFPFLPLASYPFAGALLISLPLGAYTVIIAVMVDLHLLKRLPVNWIGRVIDGMLLGTIGLAFPIVSSFLFRTTTSIPLPPPCWKSDELSAYCAPFKVLPDTLLSTLERFHVTDSAIIWSMSVTIIGFLVPVTACKTLLRRDEFHSMKPAGQNQDRHGLPARAIVNVRERRVTMREK